MLVCVTRRQVLSGFASVGALGAAGILLSACAGSGGGVGGANGADSGLGRLDIPDYTATQATKDLWHASTAGDVAGVKAALAAGADIEGIDFSENSNGRRALNYAAIGDHVDVIETLLAAGANLESQNRTRFTPLHHAAEAGSLHAIKALLQHGANKKAKMYRGGIPQQIAEFKGHREAALLLIP